MRALTKKPPISSATRLGSLLFVSGQGGLDPVTGEIVGDSIEEQTVQTILNIKSILEENELSLSQVKMANIYLSKRDHYAEFNEFIPAFSQNHSRLGQLYIAI